MKRGAGAGRIRRSSCSRRRWRKRGGSAGLGPGRGRASGWPPGRVAAGAAGVVLDGALLLARESPIGADWRERIARWDGSETTVVMPASGPGVRVLAMPGSSALARLRQAAEAGGAGWEAAVADLVGWGPGQCPPVGQDAALAGGLARRFVTVGGIVQAVERAIAEGIAAARAARPLAEGSPLAVEHGTRYPILQGPMTRVSDVAPFAEAVAREGGLPFLALAMLRGAEVRALLARRPAGSRAGPGAWASSASSRPSCAPSSSRPSAEVRPPLALIAGGRPDQAAGLEREGIAHVPARPLAGPARAVPARRLRGGSCSRAASAAGTSGRGRASCSGSRPSTVVAEAIDRGVPAERDQPGLRRRHPRRPVGGAGRRAGRPAGRARGQGRRPGRHRVPVHPRGGRRPARSSPRFQDEAIRCERDGAARRARATRCGSARTPFVARFDEERQRLIAEGGPAEEIREALEGLNVGRLRVAAKGVDRSTGAGSPLVAGERRRPGEPTACTCSARPRPCATATTTIARAPPRDLPTASTALLDRDDRGRRCAGRDRSRAAPVGHRDRRHVGGLPRRRRRRAVLGQHAPRASTRSPRSRRTAGTGGSITTPTRRRPTRSSRSGAGSCPTSPSTRSATACRRRACRRSSRRNCWRWRSCAAALADAGYAERPFPRERTAVVLGMGGGAAQLAMGYAFRSYLPMLDTVIPGGGHAGDRAPAEGCCPNGPRTRSPASCSTSPRAGSPTGLNLGGANYTVDAACGSSLAAAVAGRPRAGDRRGRHGDPGRRRHGAEPVHLPGLQQDAGVLAAGPLPAVRRRGRRHRDQRGRRRGRAQAPGRRRARRRPDLRRDQGRGRLERRPRQGPDRAGGRRAGPGPRAGLRQGRRLAGDGRLRRGARHRHGRWATSSRSRRSARSSARPGPSAGLRRRLGQVADRPHQVRRRAGRADQRLAGAASQGPAADDRHRDAQPQARPARRPVPPLHRRPSRGSIPTPTGRAGPASAPSGSAGRTSTPSSRHTTATRARAPASALARLAGGAAGLARPTSRPA